MELKVKVNRNKETKCMQILKEKIKDDKVLHNFDSILEDRFLLHFLRGRKYNVERALKTMHHYFHVRKVKHREIFIDFIPSQIFLYNSNCVRRLKNLGAKGHVILVTALEWWPDPELFPNGNMIEHLMKKGLLLTEEIWNDENAEIMGLEGIMDLEGFTLAHAKALCSVRDMIRLLNIFIGGMPFRYKKLHVINAPTSFKMVYRLAKMVAPRKFIDRIDIYTDDIDGLYDHAPKEILPDFLGGFLSDDTAFDSEFHESITSEEKDQYYLRFNEKLGLFSSPS